MITQLLYTLKTILGQFTFFAGDIVVFAEYIRDAAGRQFNGEPLVAALRAAQKIAFDVSAVKKTT